MRYGWIQNKIVKINVNQSWLSIQYIYIPRQQIALDFAVNLQREMSYCEEIIYQES